MGYEGLLGPRFVLLVGILISCSTSFNKVSKLVVTFFKFYQIHLVEYVAI